MKLETRVMIIGGILGGLLGAGAAYLYLQSTQIEVDEEGNEQLPSVQPGDAIKVTLGILGVLKQITGLGQSA
jgi:preprotein translocase subunit YajC